MQQPAISLDGVSKSFLRDSQTGHGVKYRLLDWFRGRREGTSIQRVLDSISLSIGHGESWGLVGPNGSGKSTLLKLLARILEPDAGTIRVDGQVCALLELGAGFHPELTGRENIYLNGSILGLKRHEIDARIDQIIAFSELEQHIDAPVRTYSSGMYLRLGFAVALSSEPDILLIDEIFAVGDAGFQRRCKERILDLKGQGTTIVFVSHDMDAVCQVCSRGILLHNGSIVAEGLTGYVAEKYAQLLGASVEIPASDYLNPEDQEVSLSPEVETKTAPTNETEEERIHRYCLLLDDMQRRHHLDLNRPRRFGNQEVRITGVVFRSQGTPTSGIARGGDLTIEISYTMARQQEVVVGIGIHSVDGVHISGPNSRTEGFVTEHLPATGVLTYAIPALWLHSGEYYVSVAIYDEQIQTPLDHHHKGYTLKVYPNTQEEPGGLIHLRGTWSHHANS